MAKTSTSIEPIAESRYTLIRTLGTGASGSVYLALDGETGGQVALKKLFRLDQKSVQRFKREFRSLTDLHHPNLVKLFDLQRGSDAWFLTMEYVEGVELRSQWVDSSDVLVTNHGVTRHAFDAHRLAELIRVFHELASGVQALHRAGLLHRDLKPSNVLIAKTGRVVVLDFGLIRVLDEEASHVTHDGTVSGTPAYMPPEQAFGQALSEASDWYAFGTMLYEALAGQLPIDEHNITRLLQRKLNTDPAPLSHKRLGVPRELTDLCMQLLLRDPVQRPAGKDILELFARLRGRDALEITQTEELSIYTEVGTGTGKKRTSLVGRDPALAQLRAALARARGGASVTVSVRGGSGSGKTALISHFLADAERGGTVSDPSPLVLRSRCYERESMPFKALDGAIDALVQFLSEQDELQVAHVIPGGLVDLTQLFPSFQRLPVVQQLMLRKRPHPDLTHTRQRAEECLRELIHRIAAQRPVVLWIDDLQWGDLDSASVLCDWFSQPSASPLLLILSYREEELHTSACLRVLEQPLLSGRALIELSALTDTEVQALCAQRVPSDAPKEVVERIVAEARGNPFLVLQLGALAQAKLARGELDLEDISISELIVRSSALLPAGARAVLDVLAIAGRALVPHLALRAAGVDENGRTLIHALQGLRLLRSRTVNGERLLEIYHDRVREAVQLALDVASRQRIHARLLRVMEDWGLADCDWLHDLAVGAGETSLALGYGVLAAERADRTLAFERSIELYQRCLRLTESKAEQAQLWGKLAGVLARSRRGAEAADAYLQSADNVEPAKKLPLLQLAASHLLRTGRFQEGERLVQRVLEMQGLDVPKTELGLYAAIGWERTRLALRGTSFVPNDRVDVNSSAIHTLQLYGMLSVETQFYAPLRAALFQARALRMSLDAGHPASVARALCLTATVSCLAGTERAAQRADEQLARAEAMSAELNSPDLRSELFSARTICGFLLGNMLDVLTASDVADHIYRTHRTGGEQGDYYYLFAVHCARIGALHVLGRFKAADQELREFVARAEATANRTALLQATLVRTVRAMSLDRGSEVRARLDLERDQLPADGIGILHFLHLASAMYAACNTGEFDWANAVIDRYWQPCLDSPLRHGLMLRFILHSGRAALLLNQYVARGRQGDPGGVVREDLRALRGIRLLRLSDPARTITARIAYLRGDIAEAKRAIGVSALDYQQLGCAEFAARENLALGCLTAGAEGARVRAEAIATSLALGVVNPVSFFRTHYPELAIDAGL